MVNDTIIRTMSSSTIIPYEHTLFADILIAILLLLIGLVVGRIVQRLILALLNVLDLDKLFNKQTGFRFSISHLIAGVFRYSIYLVFIIMAINALGITKTITWIVIVILALVVGLSVLLGINDVLANVYAGMIVRWQHKAPLQKIIVIREKNIRGKVLSHHALSVVLEIKKNEHVHVPYMLLMTSKVKIEK